MPPDSITASPLARRIVGNASAWARYPGRHRSIDVARYMSVLLYKRWLMCVLACWHRPGRVGGGSHRQAGGGYVRLLLYASMSSRLHLVTLTYPLSRITIRAWECHMCLR